MTVWMICCVQLCCDLISLIFALYATTGDVKELIPLSDYILNLSIMLILFSMISSDDRSSAASGLDVADRLTYLEQRMQMQEDEIQLLKMALADVLKRLNISEEHQAAAAATGRRPLGAKGEQRSVWGLLPLPTCTFEDSLRYAQRLSSCILDGTLI